MAYLKYSYHVGVGKIYQESDIDEAKKSPSFQREYNLQYLGKIGNIFAPFIIDKAIALGEQLKDKPMNQYTSHVGSIDPGFSKVTPLYITEFDNENKCVRIIYHEAFDNKATPEGIASRMHDISQGYINLKWYIDGSNRGFINSIKTMFDESLTWDKPEDVFTQASKIIPVNFAHSHKQMLEHCMLLVSAGKVAIPEKYDRLIIALRTAQGTEYNLDKENTVNDDDLDCLRMALIPVKFGKRA
jgi:hypothetical protein